MKMQNKILLCAGAVLVQLAASAGAPLQTPPVVPRPAPPLALDMAVSVPIDISTDGELLLLFGPGCKDLSWSIPEPGSANWFPTRPAPAISPPSRRTRSMCASRTFRRPAAAGSRSRRSTTSRKRNCCHSVTLLLQPATRSSQPRPDRLHSRTAIGCAQRGLQPLPPEPIWAPSSTCSPSRPMASGSRSATRAKQISWIELGTGKRGASLRPAACTATSLASRRTASHLLARSSNGEVTGCRSRTGVARSFGARPVGRLARRRHRGPGPQRQSPISRSATPRC